MGHSRIDERGARAIEAVRLARTVLGVGGPIAFVEASQQLANAIELLIDDVEQLDRALQRKLEWADPLRPPAAAQPEDAGTLNLIEIDAQVMFRLRAPFGCELIPGAGWRHWRIHDANDATIASVSYREEGYARLIVDALNERAKRLEAQARCNCERGPVLEHETGCASREGGR